MPDDFQYDLVVLAPDSMIEHTLRGLFERKASLGLRPFSFHIIPFARHDPGCFRESAAMLHRELRRSRRALVVFDHKGSGQEQLFREEIERIVESQLSANGWDGRAAVVVISPELEAWAFAESNYAPKMFHFNGNYAELKQWLRGKGLLDEHEAKPKDPKSALDAVLRQNKIPRSSSLFLQLAQKVSLKHCADPAFRKLAHTLQTWFPADE